MSLQLFPKLFMIID